MQIIIPEILLAVVELPQRPLLLLKLYRHKGCAGAAAVVRRPVPDDAICRCRGLLHPISVFLSLYSITTYLKCIPWQYCRMYSLDIPVYS